MRSFAIIATASIIGTATASFDQVCAAGIQGKQKSWGYVCFPQECISGGGSGCSSRGGATECCGSKIYKAWNSCSTNAAPCVVTLADVARVAAEANPTTQEQKTLAEHECDKTTCSLITNPAGYKVIQVVHPTNNDFESVCHDGQDYSAGAQNIAHTTAITKHCAMISATDCACYKAGHHPNGAVPASVANSPAGWSGSDGTGTATHMDYSKRDAIVQGLADHAAIDKITKHAQGSSASDGYSGHVGHATAARTQDGTTYDAHDGHHDANRDESNAV